MIGLRISAKLTLPIDFVTKTCGILAQRRKGKTYTASVLAEELVAIQQPFVALDPTGAWWGLRSSADGKRAGLPVVILGGRHGDIPLERTSGKLIAELVVDHPGYYVIDFSLFESNEAERQFAADFMERLYRLKGQEGKDFPMHLFVDEADRFAPQRPQPGDQRMLGACEAIVRRGGLRGLGTTLISQRAAVVNKNVLEQVDMLILLRTVGPNDRKAVDEYVISHGTDEERKALAGSMSSLGLGEAWIWEPGAEPPLFDRVQIRERKTFNSSATPKPGEHRVEPKRLADVDLDVLRKKMSDTVERAKADDPKELRRRIRELEQQLADPTRAVEKEVEVIPAEILEWHEDFAKWETDFHQFVSDMRTALVGLQNSMPEVPELRTTTRTPRTAIQAKKPEVSQVRAPRTGDNPGDTRLTGPERKLLTVLATHGPRGRRQLAMQAGYSPKGGAFGNPLGSLRSKGYVEGSNGAPIAATAEGLEALGDYEQLPSGPALLTWWMLALTGPERKVLGALIEAGGELDRSALAEAAGYSPVGGAFGNPLGRLRTLELVSKGQPVKVSDEFWEAIQ